MLENFIVYVKNSHRKHFKTYRKRLYRVFQHFRFTIKTLYISNTIVGYLIVAVASVSAEK